ncbi:MAG: hypothetical protein WA667_10075 [Candidatus Nitrosopolaris sp.]
MSYALSGVALTVAAAEAYSTVYNVDIPEYVGPVLAVTVIGTAFGYGYLTRNRPDINPPTTHHHHHDISPPSSIDSKPKEETESS